MAGRTRWGALALCLTTVIVSPRRVGAEQPSAPPGGKAPVDEARDRYRRGVRLYEEGDYPAALVEFRRAYELSPAFQVLYNIGHVYRQLQNYAEALRWLEKYLQDGGRSVPQARADEVQREVDELRRRVAQLDIVCEVPGAMVFVDDELVGETPLGKQLRVSAGRRRLKVQKAGYNVFEQSFEIAGAETRAIQVALVESTVMAPAPLVQRGGPEREPWHRWTTLSWVGLGAAGVLGIGAAVTGSLAYRDASDVKDSSKEGPVDGAVRDQSAQAKGLAITSDVLLGAAALTAGVTLTLTLLRSPPPASADARRGPDPWSLAVGPTGIGIRHTF